ncbi:MAG: short chain dehydrogenase [Bacteroidota bacterium]
MKIVVIGGQGTIGKKVVEALSEKAEIIIASRSQGDVLVNLESSASIKNMFQNTGELDAIICIAGEAKWAPFKEMTEEDFHIGLNSKLMGQVNLVRLGQSFLKKGGSFTLTTGILADDPVVQTTSAAMVNGAIHSFVLAAALELENAQRINVVSSGLVEDAYERYKDYFPGHTPIPMRKVTDAYMRSVFGKGTGEIIRVYN